MEQAFQIETHSAFLPQAGKLLKSVFPKTTVKPGLS